MTTLSKLLLTVAIFGLAAGSIVASRGVGGHPTLAVLMPMGAIAFGLFLIVFILEKEVAMYDQEQAQKMQWLQATAPNHPLTTPRLTQKPKAYKVKLMANPGTQGAAAASAKNILVPIDFSDGSKKALQYAVHFAKQLGGEIILLHVLPPLSPDDDLYEDEQAHKLRAWAEEFVPHGIPVRIQTRTGTEAIEIAEAARSSEAGLMVISTHGRTGRAHELAGSLAETLVKLAPCPVLVVRQGECDFIETAKTSTAPDFVAAAI